MTKPTSKSHMTPPTEVRIDLDFMLRASAEPSHQGSTPVTSLGIILSRSHVESVLDERVAAVESVHAERSRRIGGALGGVGGGG